MSTLHALENLLRKVTETPRQPRGKLNSVFIDFMKAFEYQNRSKLVKNSKK
jgi:hypothetical protein